MNIEQMELKLQRYKMLGLPQWCRGKESACQCRTHRRFRFISGLGKYHVVGMATRSRILAWKIPWTEELGGLQSMGSQKVGYDSVHMRRRRRNLHLAILLLTQHNYLETHKETQNSFQSFIEIYILFHRFPCINHTIRISYFHRIVQLSQKPIL